MPNSYSTEMKNLIQRLLTVDPKKRPSLKEILKMPIVAERVRQTVNNEDFVKEFTSSSINKQNLFNQAQKRLQQQEIDA